MALNALTEQYRDGDYDHDYDHTEVASNPEGVKENQQFVANLFPHHRRTSSLNDVSRYTRYFSLIEKNYFSRGYLFTWKQYLDVLETQLRSFEANELMQPKIEAISDDELEFPRVISSSKIHPSKSKTRSFSCKRLFGKSATTAGEEDQSSPAIKRTFSFRKFQHSSSGESTPFSTPVGSVLSLRMSPQDSIMKKVCKETKILARKICKTVEKISTLPHKCASCGSPLVAAKHKNCITSKEPPQAVGDSEIVDTKSSYETGKGGVTNVVYSKPSKSGYGIHRNTETNKTSVTKENEKELALGAAGESVSSTPKMELKREPFSSRKKKISTMMRFL